MLHCFIQIQQHPSAQNIKPLWFHSFANPELSSNLSDLVNKSRVRGGWVLGGHVARLPGCQVVHAIEVLFRLTGRPAEVMML